MASLARVQVSSKAVQARRVSRASAVRPVAALSANSAKVAAAGVASLAVAASFVAPAEAAQVMSTMASAASGYPFVPPAWAPSVFVPLTGLVLPAIAMATLFVYIEKERA